MKTAQFLMVAALCSVAIGCTNADIAPDAPLANTSGGVNVTITASTGPNTRTTVDFGNPDIDGGEKVKWLEGDAISVFMSDQEPYYSSATLKASKISKDGSTANFTGKLNTLATGSQTVYALSPCRTFINPGSIDFTYPINQIQSGETADHIRTNMISYAKVEFDVPEMDEFSGLVMPPMEFKQLGAILRFQIKNYSHITYYVKRIKVFETGPNERLYHRMNINLTKEKPTFTPIKESTVEARSLQVNGAPMMYGGGDGIYDCYMTIAPQTARKDDNDYLRIEVLVEDDSGEEHTRSLALQCNTTDLIKNGFDAGKRYNFVIKLTDENLEKPNKFTTVTVGEDGKLAFGTDVTHLKLKGKISAQHFSAFGVNRDTNSKLKVLDLSDVTIENNTIPEGGFSNPNLVSIRLPSTLTTIEINAFYGAGSLTDIILPEGLTSIGESAFESCSGLRLLTIPEGVTSIGKKAFYRCENLISVTIPDGVTTIEDKTFQHCESLTSITIHEKVEKIGEYAFANCKKIEKIIVNWTEEKSIPPYAQDMFHLQGDESGAQNKATISIPSGSITHYQGKWIGGLDYEERVHIDY